jgi:CBS domain-containing protein
METVKILFVHKPGDVLKVTPDTTVLEAARLMNHREVGSVLVVQDGNLVGIFTERDLMRRVVARELLPGTTRVGDVMTSSLVTCTPEARIVDCNTIMSERRIRHLPVVDLTGVVGVITTGDLLAHELHEKDSTIHQLESFVFNGR